MNPWGLVDPRMIKDPPLLRRKIDALAATLQTLSSIRLLHFPLVTNVIKFINEDGYCSSVLERINNILQTMHKVASYFLSKEEMTQICLLTRSDDIERYKQMNRMLDIAIRKYVHGLHLFRGYLGHQPIDDVITMILSLRSLNMIGKTELEFDIEVIGKLPREISCFSELVELRLSNNSLEDLPREIVELEKLKTLDLFENRFTTFPSQILQMTWLKELVISKNLLRELPSGIGKLIHLETLLVGVNPLCELPEEIGLLTKLVRLGLKKSLLISLPDSFRNLTALQILDLSRNFFQTIPAQLMNLQLSVLKLGFNIIVSVDLKQEDLPNLGSLSLVGNFLEKFDISRPRKSLENINLCKNPKLLILPKLKAKPDKFMSRSTVKLGDTLEEAQELAKIQRLAAKSCAVVFGPSKLSPPVSPSAVLVYYALQVVRTYRRYQASKDRKDFKAHKAARDILKRWIMNIQNMGKESDSNAVNQQKLDNRFKRMKIR
jgi:hypothetical protein